VFRPTSDRRLAAGSWAAYWRGALSTAGSRTRRSPMGESPAPLAEVVAAAAEAGFG